MEPWVPLFNIFLNSPTPETEASLWLQQSFNPSSATPISTSSFVSLLAKPIDTLLTSSSPPATKKAMFIQTLSSMVQVRIISFLDIERARFCKRDLCELVRGLWEENGGVDFWVKRAARNLFDKMSDSSYEWISGLCLDSGGERIDEEFESVPSWLKNVAASGGELCFPWLPVSVDELRSRELFSSNENEQDSLSEVGDGGGGHVKEVVEGMEIDGEASAPFVGEIENVAGSLKVRVMNFESTSKTMELANEICQLCLQRGRKGGSAILVLIELWKVDDEIASIMLSHLPNGNEDDLSWPSQVLCSIVLPKMLALEEPASCVLMVAIIEYCKLHQRAAEYALLFPLVMRKGGINNLICDVITRILKECLQPAHVSAFCQKLLCDVEVERFIILPFHAGLVSNELVWTESLFNLFQNILNHNIQLTQDSLHQLVVGVQEMAQRFSRSLKFGNFFLCLVNKCALLLGPHKALLSKAVKQTNTLVTNSILSKLASL